MQEKELNEPKTDGQPQIANQANINQGGEQKVNGARQDGCSQQHLQDRQSQHEHYDQEQGEQRADQSSEQDEDHNQQYNEGDDGDEEQEEQVEQEEYEEYEEDEEDDEQEEDYEQEEDSYSGDAIDVSNSHSDNSGHSGNSGHSDNSGSYTSQHQSQDKERGNQNPQHQDQQQEQTYQNQITINEDTINQILTVHLNPGDSIYHRGEVVVSNRSFHSSPNQNAFNLVNLIEQIKFKLNPLIRLHNTEKSIAYYCLRRKGGGGKILHLQSSVYRHSFIIDYFKLLTTNQAPENFSLHSSFANSRLYKLKWKSDSQDQMPPVSVTLQTNPGSIIVEKYLGQKQKFYTRLGHILAHSENMNMKRDGSESVCLTGPGYVFIESSNTLGNPLGHSGFNEGRFLAILLLTLVFVMFYVGDY